MSDRVTRVPVISPEGKPLMPTTAARVREWLRSGKAQAKRHKLGVFYVQLVNQPSGYATQPIVAGADRGKCFTGLAFQSKLATIAVFHLCLPGFYKSDTVGEFMNPAFLRPVSRGRSRITENFRQFANSVLATFTPGCSS